MCEKITKNVLCKKKLKTASVVRCASNKFVNDFSSGEYFLKICFFFKTKHNLLTRFTTLRKLLCKRRHII